MSGIQQALLASGKVRVLTYVGNTTDTTDTDVYTFSGAALGSPTGDRRVIVGVLGDATGGGTISGVTVGGVAATIVVQGANNNTVVGIVIALVPTGATGDIVVTFGGAHERCNIGVWTMTGLTSNTAIDTGTSTANPGTDTLTSAVGGACIAIAATSVATTLSWANVDEKYDAQPEGNCTVSGASIVPTGTSISPAGTFASGAGNEISAFATW